MNHQPFENWIFEDETLNSDEEQRLKQHLKECKTCESAHKSWLSLQDEITQAPIQPPVPGFSQRWLASLPQRRLREQRRQAKKFVVFLAGAAALSFLLLIGLMIMDQSPLDWIIGGLHTIAQVAIRLKQIQLVALSIIKSLPPFVPVIAWISLTLPLGLLSLTWIGALWRISAQGVGEK